MEEDQSIGEAAKIKKSILVWPILSQAYGTILVLVTKPIPMLELTVKESAGLSMLYAFSVLGGAYLILYLLKKGLIKFLQAIFLLSLFMSSVLSLNHLLAGIRYGTVISLLASLAMILLWNRPGTIGNLVKVIFAASTSYIILSTFPESFIIILLGLLAIYDAYSVFKGPLGKIFSSLEIKTEVLSPFFVVHRGMGMGIGDLLLYSLAASFSARTLGFPLALLPLAFLNIGILISLELLIRRKSAFPGITIPIALWLPSFLLAKLALP
jgi:hypothetical protein